jgi:polyisoprenoid-binding protein YceI
MTFRPLLFALLLATAMPAAGASWRLDPVHCQVLFFVDHLGFSRQVGRFPGVSGTIDFDPDDWTAGRVDVEIAIGSLWLGDAGWERKMLSDDFFDAKAHPVARFVGERMEATGDSTARLHGNLSLLGVTRPVVLDVQRNRIGRNSFNFKQTAGFSARTTIRRSDFGMTRLKAAVGDEVEIVIEIEAIRE